jgi:hypothetical protein
MATTLLDQQVLEDLLDQIHIQEEAELDIMEMVRMQQAVIQDMEEKVMPLIG